MTILPVFCSVLKSILFFFFWSIYITGVQSRRRVPLGQAFEILAIRTHHHGDNEYWLTRDQGDMISGSRNSLFNTNIMPGPGSDVVLADSCDRGGASQSSYR